MMYSKLSRLEKLQLKKLFQLVGKIESSEAENSDNVCDFLYKQFPVEVEENERLVLQSAREHLTLAHEANQRMFEVVSLLKDHFDI